MALQKRRLSYQIKTLVSSFRIVSAMYRQCTSQQCSQCGHTSSENRKVQEKFSCVECGHSENADINAAKNILQKI